jgi:REP element-mobilizing transposase RayT
MKNAPQHRRSIRLKGFDYAEASAYFVTIVTQNRSSVFGEIIEGQMQLNPAGEAMARWWLELPRKFSTIETDEFIVMPNHCHGIIVITGSPVGADLRVGPPNIRKGAHAGAPLQKIMQWFKTMTTNEYMRGVTTLGWSSFPGRLWQRSFYDHVIRDEDSLNRIRQYILDNPPRWEFDRENPALVTVERDAAY